MSRVEFKHVEKIYTGKTRAIHDFSMVIEEGEFMVMVGPSGCGKSTLMRILAGLETCTSGEIRLDDQYVNDWTPQQRNVAMVFQNYALYPHMTVQGNLEFPLRMRKFTQQEKNRRVTDASKLLGLEELLERKPAQLSGGQRQRVAMGRALVRDPSVFLLDEPLSNLDARLRVQIRTEIGALQRRMRKTTLYVTHDQVEAMTLGDRVCVMNKGKLQQIATPLELYERPANVFVAGFLGSPGMNFLAAEYIKSSDNSLMFSCGVETLTLQPGNTSNDIPAEREKFVVGIRPESLSLAPPYTPQDMSLNMRVKSLESLGHEHLVYGVIADSSTPLSNNDFDTEILDGVSFRHITARVPASERIAAGDEITLSAPMNQIHIFNTEGQRMEYFDPQC